MLPAISVVVSSARFFLTPKGSLCFLFLRLYVGFVYVCACTLGIELSLAVVGLYGIDA